MFSFPLWRYMLTAVMRDRIIHLLIVMMLLGVSAAFFLGSAAVIEKQPFTIATAGTILRMLSVLGLVTFICFFVRRIFESREIDYLLATPLTRQKLLVSFAGAFISLALVLSTAIALIVLVLLQKITPGWLVWSFSVFVELSITCMIALFFSIALKSATISVLSSLGFYSLSRMLGAMIGIITSKVGEGRLPDFIISCVVKVISLITPRFDLMAQSAWLIYGNDAGVPLWILPAQLVVFCGLFLCAAAFDLRRSQF